MADRVRVREREALLTDAPGNRACTLRTKDLLERSMTGKILVKFDERDWEMSQMGKLKWLFHADFYDDTALNEWWVFTHDIKVHTGSHRHQGGLIIYVLQGSGYTVVDGVKEEWEEGDLLLLPIKPGGVEHQHFNSNPGEPCMWIALRYVPLGDALANEIVAGKNAPDFGKS